MVFCYSFHQCQLISGNDSSKPKFVKALSSVMLRPLPQMHVPIHDSGYSSANVLYCRTTGLCFPTKAWGAPGGIVGGVAVWLAGHVLNEMATTPERSKLLIYCYIFSRNIDI